MSSWTRLLKRDYRHQRSGCSLRAWMSRVALTTGCSAGPGYLLRNRVDARKWYPAIGSVMALVRLVLLVIELAALGITLGAWLVSERLRLDAGARGRASA